MVLMYLSIVLVSVLPALGWLWFFHSTDRYEPEPRKLVLRTFLLGVFFALALGTTYGGLPYPWGPARYAAVIWAPLVEETGKFLIVFWTVFRNRNFNEPMDGIVYAASAALGFAACENAFYVVANWSSAGAGIGVYTLLGRSIFSVPGHALFSSFWGAALGFSIGKKGIKPILAVALGLLASMAAHGLFNWFTMENHLEGLAFIAFCALLWRLVYKVLILRALSHSPHRQDAEE